MGLFNVQNAFICLHSFIHFPCVCQSFHLILIIQGVRQGTSYSCFTYKETQAQEGELFTQSHIITGRTGTWIKFSWLPVPGCLRLLSNYFNAFTGEKKSPDLVNGKAQPAFLLDYILSHTIKDTGVSFLHQIHYTFAFKALVPIMEKITLNYIFPLWKKQSKCFKCL